MRPNQDNIGNFFNSQTKTLHRSKGQISEARMQFSKQSQVADEVTYYQNLAEQVTKPFQSYVRSQNSPEELQSKHMLIRSGTQEAGTRKSYLLAQKQNQTSHRNGIHSATKNNLQMQMKIN